MKTKPIEIPKRQVMEAYRLVKSNSGSAGVDGQSLDAFSQDMENNLYQLWNRLSSGSYFPPAVKGVPIPKRAGGTRLLGVPTVTDRIAQMVVKLQVEPLLEPLFLEDSYGYRPNKSALDAVGVTRTRCWANDWVLEFDIKGLFDNIPHSLLLKALRKHVECRWSLLYIERWLRAPMCLPDGSHVVRDRGVPQGGVISPLMSNLFLHYVFDVWMTKYHPQRQWCRYADDGLVHCTSFSEAQRLLGSLSARFRECGLELHPTKTKIVYCKDSNRRETYPVTAFDFLGFTFRGRSSKNRSGHLFISFSPAISTEARKAMTRRIRRSRMRHMADRSIEDLARIFNPALRGWLNYYGRYCPSALYPFLRSFNRALVSWAMRKYRRFHRKRTRAGQFMEGLAASRPDLFVHWRRGMTGVFV